MAITVTPLSGRVMAPAASGIGCALPALALAPVPAVGMTVSMAIISTAAPVAAILTPMAAITAAPVAVAASVAVPAPIIPALIGQGRGGCDFGNEMPVPEREGQYGKRRDPDQKKSDDRSAAKYGSSAFHAADGIRVDEYASKPITPRVWGLIHRADGIMLEAKTPCPPFNTRIEKGKPPRIRILKTSSDACPAGLRATRRASVPGIPQPRVIESTPARTMPGRERSGVASHGADDERFVRPRIDDVHGARDAGVE